MTRGAKVEAFLAQNLVQNLGPVLPVLHFFLLSMSQAGNAGFGPRPAAISELGMN